VISSSVFVVKRGLEELRAQAIGLVALAMTSALQTVVIRATSFGEVGSV
jgi:hypothetical protein